jgi:hypothetical protein
MEPYTEQALDGEVNETNKTNETGAYRWCIQVHQKESFSSS